MHGRHHPSRAARLVSMKSGLEGRNNTWHRNCVNKLINVSMKSGLEGRNNVYAACDVVPLQVRLNEVRPRRPEQLT